MVSNENSKTLYICPMHPEIQQPQPGKCPKCGMDLILKGNKPKVQRQTIKDFLPLIIIFLVIFFLTSVMVWQLGYWDTMFAMRYFEGFFFLIFGIFKLLNLKGFVDAYSTYDIIAKRNRFYAYLYPFIELGLAVGYLFSFQLLAVAWTTLILMLIGSVGVVGELKKKNQIPCACLGVVFKIPMTWVTFIEDIIMAVMAAVMIYLQ